MLSICNRLHSKGSQNYWNIETSLTIYFTTMSSLLVFQYFTRKRHTSFRSSSDLTLMMNANS